jgi:hypothetical protein
LAEALLEYETLDGPEIGEIIDTGKLSKPPTRGPGLGASATTASQKAPAGTKTEPFPAPGIGPSPANA